MSSSNRVRLSLIAETVYGVTPGTGNFTEARITSEDLSGTPQTAESAEIRSDRQNGGQINTGLELTGGYNFELSADASLKLITEHAMMSDIVAAKVHTGSLDISGSGTVLTTDGSFTADGIADGDFVILDGFATNPENNTGVIVSNVTALTATIVGEGLIDELGGGGETATVPSFHDIGIIEKSLSISKEFLDLGNRNIAYTGERVSEFALNFAFGAIVTGRASLAGNGYSTPALPITNGRTIDASGSDQSLDASNGFGWLLVDNVDLDICVESIDLTLNNGLSPENCVGALAPTDQVPGSAAVTFAATVHLSAASFDTFMSAKIAQTGMSISFYARDDQGKGYAVVIDRVQVTFPDPATSGKDTTVTIGLTGTASYSSSTAGTMRIYIIE